MVKVPSAAAGREAMESPELRQTRRELEAIAHSHMHSYRLVRSLPAQK
jgi:hypothetical protein